MNTPTQTIPTEFVPAIPASMKREPNTDTKGHNVTQLPTKTADGGASAQRGGDVDAIEKKIKAAKSPAKKVTKTKAATSKVKPAAFCHPEDVKVTMALAKAFKPVKDEKSGAFIQRVILTGKFTATDTVLAEICRRHFKTQTTTAKDVGWNRWKLRQDGKLPKVVTSSARVNTKK